MKQDALKLILLRNTFYRDNYRRARFALLIVLVINCILAGAIFYKWTHPLKPKYFAATADWRVINLHKLSDPVVTDDFVLQWTANAATQAFALDFVHWRNQLQRISNYFTPDGWTYFLKSLKDSNNLKTITELKMVENAVVTGSPEIIAKQIVGGKNGHYAWKIKLPLLVTYQNAGKTINQPMKVTLIVLRMPVQNYPDHIAINNFIADIVAPPGR